MTNAKRDAAALEHYYEFQKKDEETTKNGNVVIEARFGSFCYGYDFRDAEVEELIAQLDELNSALDLQGKVLRRYTEENEALKQQVEHLEFQNKQHIDSNTFLQNELAYDGLLQNKNADLEAQLKTRDEALSLAVKALEISYNRSLDWDLMNQKNSLELLQTWRGMCFKALQSINTLLGREG